MTETELPTYYTVIDIATGEKVYRGTSLTMAAERLNPGTVYGVGTDQAAAAHDAWAKLPDPHARRKHRLALEGV